MRYPLAIHKDDDSGYGVTVADIKGCFSAGDTIAEAIQNGREAIAVHLDLLAEDEICAPIASRLEDISDNPDFANASWYLADIDLSVYLGRTEKVAVRLPELLVRKIDKLVANGDVKSVSAFLTDGAVRIMDGSLKKSV